MKKNKFNRRVQEKAVLALKHLRGETTPSEEKKLREWLSADEEFRSLMESLDKENTHEDVLEFFSTTDVSAAWESVSAKTLKNGAKTSDTSGHFWRYAAVFLLLCTTVVALYQLNREDASTVLNDSENPLFDYDIPPGGAKATLELADGSVIDLEEAKNGRLNSGNGALIIKTDGQLTYRAHDSGEIKEVTYNTVSTPNGGQYHLVLPDGSKVWLNAASSLRLPTAFTGSERVVEVQGEAYFEVAKDRGKPFKVHAGDVSVNVLGTHFNVSAYENDSSVNATLLEGSVNISKGALNKTIVPGQQIRVNEKMQLLEVDIEQVIAWKNGYFQFDNTSLTNILKQVERWYDVKVDYNKVPNLRYSGTIARDNHISGVLNMLELTGDIQFSIQANTLTILNNTGKSNKQIDAIH